MLKIRSVYHRDSECVCVHHKDAAFLTTVGLNDLDRLIAVPLLIGATRVAPEVPVLHRFRCYNVLSRNREEKLECIIPPMPNTNILFAVVKGSKLLFARPSSSSLSLSIRAVAKNP